MLRKRLITHLGIALAILFSISTTPISAQDAVGITIVPPKLELFGNQMLEENNDSATSSMLYLHSNFFMPFSDCRYGLFLGLLDEILLSSI